MNQIKNNKNLFSYLGSEDAQNSILLGKNTGISIKENFIKQADLAGTEVESKIILQKELKIKNSVAVHPKNLNNELINLYNQNNDINLPAKKSKISTTLAGRNLEKQKLLNLKNIETEINNNLESINTTDKNKIILKNGKAISKLKAKYLNVIDMFAPVQKNSTVSSNQMNKIHKNNNNITLTKTNNNNNTVNFIFNKCSDNKISQLLNSLFKFNKDLASFQYFVYNFNSNNNKFLKNITSILNFSFVSMSSLISRPVLKISANKIVIQLFYYVKQLTSKKRLNRKLRYKMRSKIRFVLNSNKNDRFRYYNNNTYKLFLKNNIKQLKFLASNLSKILKKPVTLDLVRLHYIFNDSQILAKSIGLLSNRMRKSFYSITQNTFRKANIMNPFKIKMLPGNQILPSFNTGIKVKFAGRLMRGRMIPKKTVKLAQEGALARSKANFVTTSRFTKKNKRGIFSVTVSVGHAFF